MASSTTNATCACLRARSSTFLAPSYGTRKASLAPKPPSSKPPSSARSRNTGLPIVASAAFAIGGGGSSVSDVTSVFNAVVGLAGAAFIGRELLQRSAGSPPDDEDACPTCGGCGTEACMCRNWSDRDSGCGICENTGQMACRNCRGGGTKIPIPVPIHVEQNSDRQRK